MQIFMGHTVSRRTLCSFRLYFCEVSKPDLVNKSTLHDIQEIYPKCPDLFGSHRISRRALCNASMHVCKVSRPDLIDHLTLQVVKEIHQKFADLPGSHRIKKSTLSCQTACLHVYKSTLYVRSFWVTPYLKGHSLLSNCMSVKSLDCLVGLSKICRAYLVIPYKKNTLYCQTACL